MSWGNIAVAAASVIGGALSASSANDAAGDAANAQTGASTANTALAREQRARNEALFAQYLGDENMARAYLDALYYGTGSYTPGANIPASNIPTPVTYPLYDSHGNLISTDPLRPEQIQQLTNSGIEIVDAAGQPVMGQPEPSPEDVPQPVTITRDQVMQQIANTPLSQFANQDFAARETLASDTYNGARDLAGEEYDALTGQADANLQSRLGLEDQSYAAWLPQSQQAERDAINLNFSRGGVTGLVGQTREGVGRTTQDAAMERNLRRLQGYQTAYAPYYDEMTDATALRGERYQRGYDTYSGTRAANYDQFAGDRLNSYGDYAGFLAGRSSRGFDARSQIAAGGQAYTSAVTAANNNAANAASDAAYQRGAIQQQLYGDMADIAGSAYGAIRNSRKKA